MWRSRVLPQLLLLLLPQLLLVLLDVLLLDVLLHQQRAVLCRHCCHLHC
jgi:hypothetical protein